jgi:excinuclease UvrABC ATPase subunit
LILPENAIVIFISGSINSGKTTTAKLLQRELSNTAHIEVDELRAMIDWMPLEESIPVNIQNALSLTLNFLDKDISVIISYPLSRQEFEFFNKYLPQDVDRFFFTLNPGLDYVLSNRGARELTDRETERIKYHYQTGVNNPGFGITIDNSIQLPEETVSEMLYYIEQRDIRRNMED